MSERDELPAELRELIASERVAPGAAASERTVVRSRLAASVGAAPLGHAAAAAAGLGVPAKVIATIAIVAGIGGGTVAVMHATKAPPARSPAAPHVKSGPQAPRSADVDLVRDDAGVPVDAAAPALQVVPIETVAPRPTAPPARRTATSQPSQTELIRDAWHALAARDPERALDLVETDARAHRDGALAEEREALRVVALARLHRIDEARTAAAAFVDRYPNSIHLELVKRATQEAP
jgi:hypothetical protein